MPAFSLLAKVDQIVTKEVQFLIEAKTLEDAEATAREVLQDYPAPVKYDPMVHRVVTKTVKYWIPRNIEFTASKEEKDDNDQTT